MSMQKFVAHDRVSVKWDVDIPDAPGGLVTNANRSFVTVRFDGPQLGGINRVQKFTYRKDGRCIAACWHWGAGIPVLVQEAPNNQHEGCELASIPLDASVGREDER